MSNNQSTVSHSRSPNWVVPAAVMMGLTATSAVSETTYMPIDIAEVSVGNAYPNIIASGSAPTQAMDSYIKGWNPSDITVGWYADATARLDALSTKLDGWKGPGSIAASNDAKRYARDMLWKFSQEGIDKKPSIGLDFEGTFSLNWMDDKVSVDLTIYDDGTYSFYAKDNNTEVMLDEAQLRDPINSGLLSILLS